MVRNSQSRPQALGNLATAGTSVDSASRSLAETIKANDQFVSTTMREVPTPANRAGERICTEADKLTVKLVGLEDPKALRESVLDLSGMTSEAKEALEKLEQRVAEVTSANPASAVECNQRVGGVKLLAQNSIRVAVHKLADANQLLGELTAKKQDFENRRKEILKVLADPRSFAEVYYLPSSRQPVEHTVSIEKKDRLANNATTQIPVSEAIRVGTSRFSLSVGVGLSFIGERTFIRQQATITNEQGGTTIGEVVGIGEQSEEKFGAVTQGNVLFGNLGRKVKWGWSLGISVDGGDLESDFGYYTGPSLAFADGQWFVTFGYHHRNVIQEAPGFVVGDPIPQGLEGEIPTREDRERGLLLTFGYRIGGTE